MNYLYISNAQFPKNQFKTIIHLVLICFLSFASFGQTTYTFMSAGAEDSGGTGFKTTTTSPTEANLIISNNINQGFGPNVLYPNKTTTVPTNPVTFIIKGNGTNTNIFNVVDMNIFTYSGSPKTVDFENVTQLDFKDFSGNTITTWNTLAISTLTTNTNYSIKDIFGQTSGVDNVSEILLTVDFTGSDDITDFELRTITLDNVTLNTNTYDIEQKINIYPNPTKGLVNLSISPETISIFTISGQKLMTSTDKSFDISILESGIYFIDISTKKGKTTKQLIKL